ncbi:MAG: hypothetical protein ABL877_04080 [Thiobacillus sp.]
MKSAYRFQKNTPVPSHLNQEKFPRSNENQTIVVKKAAVKKLDSQKNTRVESVPIITARAKYASRSLRKQQVVKNNARSGRRRMNYRFARLLSLGNFPGTSQLAPSNYRRRYLGYGRWLSARYPDSVGIDNTPRHYFFK